MKALINDAAFRPLDLSMGWNYCASAVALLEHSQTFS